MKRGHLVTLIIIIVLIIDQASKIYIKTNFEYGKGFLMFGLDWARIHFVENDGMAFGLSFGGVTGKYLLSIFRIVLVMVLIYIIRGMIQANENKGLVISFALIIAGAIGNILDSAFYGMIFSETPTFHGGIAELFPEGGGYAPFLQGKVVDMLYFPMYEGSFPDWFPRWGGDRFSFFNPVFNVADTSISIGVITILVFYRSFFKSDEQIRQEKEAKLLEEGKDQSIDEQESIDNIGDPKSQE